MKKLLFALGCLLLTPQLSLAELAIEKTGQVATLPATPNPHWVFVNDISFGTMLDGRSYLIDGDTGKMLGSLHTGFGFDYLTIASDFSAIYSSETYYSRGSRGVRTDVVTVYDPVTLSDTGEVILPPKIFTGVPVMGAGRLTDDDQFMLVFNMTPATSVSVVDVKAKKFVGEIEIPGCSLIYPSGNRQFLSLCANGSLLTVNLDDAGKAADKVRGESFFDVEADPVTEKAVRYGETWLFVSFEGYIHPVDVSGDLPKPGEKWSLVSDEERAANWRIGGPLHLDVHQATGKLFALMHQGPKDTHKDPGTEIWVYDLKTRQRSQRIQLTGPTLSMQVSQDDKPLLFTLLALQPMLQVYDALSGESLRTAGPFGSTPLVLQTVPYLKDSSGE